MDNQECERYRQYFEGLGHAADLELSAAMDEHVGHCSRCRDLKVQTLAIAKMTAELPQFDVPESLTQNILRSVEGLRGEGRGSEYSYFLPLSILCVAVVCLTMPLESAEGTASWAIGLTGLLAFQLLLKGAGSESRST
jgi:hypothetical protein